MVDKVIVEQMIIDNGLHIIAGKKGLSAPIETETICRPGMEFAGFFDYYEARRIVLIGSKEAAFLKSLSVDIAKERVRKIFLQKPPAIIYSINVELPKYFIDFAEEYGIPFCKSDLITTATSAKIFHYLQSKIAPTISVHGTLLDIGGMGTMIIGKSGIGKSETALELIKRGHQLIADDLVEIYEKEPGYLVGQAPNVLKRYLEIRGIGVVDVVYMFGAQAYRDKKNVKLIVELEKWSEDKYYDRIGLEVKKIKYFDTEISHIVIPVLPGRNVASLVESAAMNEKLKYMGYFSAQEFTDSINKLTGGKKNDD